MFAPSAWCLLRVKETTKRKGSFKGNSNREHPLAAEYIWDYRAEATTGSNCNIGDGDYVCKFEIVLKEQGLTGVFPTSCRFRKYAAVSMALSNSPDSKTAFPAAIVAA